jgi:hypothetical protein
MRAKFPNSDCVESWVWFSRISTDSHFNALYDGPEYIDFVSFEKFNPHFIRSGLNFGTRGRFSGFRSVINYDFTNVFNVFTMEWTKDYIYWKLNGKEYHREFINRYFEFENGINYSKIRAPFDEKYLITFTISCDPINDQRVDKNFWTNPYLFIDYIKIYDSFDSENGSQLNDSTVIKYGITGFLVLFFMSVFFCLVLYYIKKRKSIKKSINSTNNNDYDTVKIDDFRQSVDLYDDNNADNYYYEIVESQVGEDSQNFNNTYLELI